MNDRSNPFVELIQTVAQSKNLAIDEVVVCLKTALEQAYKRYLNDVNVEVDIDFKKGTIRVEQLFSVIEDSQEDYDDFLEVPLTEAKKINPKIKVGEVLRKTIPLKSMSSELINKMVAIFNQKINETAFKAVMSEFINEVGEIIEAKVEDIDTNKEGNLKGYIINLETTKGYIPKRELSRGEKLEIGKKYLFVIKEVQKQSAWWPIMLSRSDSRLLQFLLSSNTPEINSGVIEIKKIERSPGIKSKVAVVSNDPSVDPIAAILGPKGERIRGISEEFNGEIIDIVFWNEDKLKFLINAVLPAEVLGYNILQDDERDTSIEIIVPGNQIANVFGFRGVNIRLISNLTGWNSVDVFSEKDATENNMEYTRLSFEPQGTFGIKKRRERIVTNEDRLSSDKVFYTSKENNVDDEIIVDLTKLETQETQENQETQTVVSDETTVELKTEPELQPQPELPVDVQPTVQPTPKQPTVQAEKPVQPSEPVQVKPTSIPSPKPASQPPKQKKSQPQKPRQGSVFSITVDGESKQKPASNKEGSKQTFDSFEDL